MFLSFGGKVREKTYLSAENGMKKKAKKGDHLSTRRFFKSCNRALKLTCFSLSTMCGTGGLSSRCEELFCERSACET